MNKYQIQPDLKHNLLSPNKNSSVMDMEHNYPYT